MTPRSRRAEPTRCTPHGSATRRARLDDADRALRDDQAIKLDLPDTDVPAGRTVFLGERIADEPWRPDAFRGRVDLTIRGPERIALTGPNGAGKSTLLRIIDGDLEPDDGTISAPTAGSPTCPSDSTCSTATAPSRKPLRVRAEPVRQTHG